MALTRAHTTLGILKGTHNEILSLHGCKDNCVAEVVHCHQPRSIGWLPLVMSINPGVFDKPVV